MANERVTTGKVVRLNDRIEIPPILSEEIVERALKNTEECAVGILEDYGRSMLVLRHWFPWMNLSKANMKEMFLSPRDESSNTLLPSHRALIEEMNSCDMRMYKQMQYQFIKQLQVIAQ
jgi:hypothetical protein